MLAMLVVYSMNSRKRVVGVCDAGRTSGKVDRTEAVMNQHFGWQQGGRTASIYTHLSGKQVDDQLLAVFGKKRIDLETNAAVDVVRCLRCGLENVPTAVQCGKCGFPLSDEAARKLLQRRQKADEILDRLTSHPEFVKAIHLCLEEGCTVVLQNKRLRGRWLRGLGTVILKIQEQFPHQWVSSCEYTALPPPPAAPILCL